MKPEAEPHQRCGLVVGQDVGIKGRSFGHYTGKVVKIESPCIWVEMADGPKGSIFRFNADGKECTPDGRAYNNAWPADYVNNAAAADDPGPYELVGGWELTATGVL